GGLGGRGSGEEGDEGGVVGENEAKGVSCLGHFRFFGNGGQEGVRLVGVDELPSAAGDSAERRVLASRLGALFQEFRPVVGCDGVEFAHQIVEGVGDDLGWPAFASVKVAAAIIERTATTSLPAYD